MNDISESAANRFQNRLEAAFPAAADANIIRAVREGILLANGLMESEPMLRSLIGRDLLGHVRRAGILFRVHEMVAAGDLPFEAQMTPMPKGSWHWVELKSGEFTANLVKTDGPTAFPEDTPVRQDCRLANQMDLFQPFVAFDDRPRLAWLMFGVGEEGQPSHLCWGMPSARSEEWLARVNILRRWKEGGEPVAQTPPPKPMCLRFKEHIEAAINKEEAAKKA